MEYAPAYAYQWTILGDEQHSFGKSISPMILQARNNVPAQLEGSNPICRRFANQMNHIENEKFLYAVEETDADMESRSEKLVFGKQSQEHVFQGHPELTVARKRRST